jgi:hypothetical protein
VIRLVHFFFVSKLQPAHAVVVCGACVALGVWTLSYDPGELDSALGLLLVVQMFLASTGFTSRAFAGHFDPVLLAGGSRPRAALAHWAVSIAPGVAGWIVLAVVALALGSPAARSALIGRRVVALIIVSNLSWVAGYRLSRGAAGVLWLIVLVAVLLQHNLRALSMTMEQGVRAWPWDTAVLLVCPFVLIGNKPEVPAAVLAAAALLACLAAASAVKATRHLNVLLMERG